MLRSVGVDLDCSPSPTAFLVKTLSTSVQSIYFRTCLYSVSSRTTMRARPWVVDCLAVFGSEVVQGLRAFRPQRAIRTKSLSTKRSVSPSSYSSATSSRFAHSSTALHNISSASLGVVGFTFLLLGWREKTLGVPVRKPADVHDDASSATVDRWSFASISVCRVFRSWCLMLSMTFARSACSVTAASTGMSM